MTISLETASLIALFTFIGGFFVNIIAMRKVFTFKSEFEDYKKDRTKNFEEHRADEIKRFEAFKEMIIKDCELRRATCGPTVNALGEDIKEIKQDIKELFRELRRSLKGENHDS